MTEKPIRIQLQRKRGWKMPPNTISVARPSKWGNPFRVKDGDNDAAVMLFKNYIMRPEIVYEVKDKLKGKNLACYCRLDQACHADVLLEMANN